MPAAPVRSRPDQREGLEQGVVAVGRAVAVHVAGIAAGFGVGRVVVPDRDRRLRADLGARIDVEDRDAVAGRGVTPGRPGGGLDGRPVLIAGPTARAAAEYQVNGALAGIEDAAVDGGHGMRAQRAGRVEAADRERALVTPVVPAQHQVDLVPVEQRQPLPPDAEVDVVADARRRARALVELDDDPVDGGVTPGGGQDRLQPAGLRAGGVAALNVVSAEADERRRADPELVPPPLEPLHPVAGQRVPGQVGRQRLLLVGRLRPVVARHRQPRSVRGRGLDVVPEVPPRLRLRRRVQVGVGQVRVEQVEQRLEALHRADRVGGLARRARPARVRRGQVAEAGEAERRPPLRRGTEGGAERVGRVAVVVRGDRVPVRRARPQAVHQGVIGQGGLAAAPVGVAPLDRPDDPLPDPHPRRLRLAGRCPRHHDRPGRVVAPGEVDLLRRTVGRPRPPVARPGRGRHRGGGEQPGRACCEQLPPGQAGLRVI